MIRFDRDQLRSFVSSEEARFFRLVECKARTIFPQINDDLIKNMVSRFYLSAVENGLEWQNNRLCYTLFSIHLQKDLSEFTSFREAFASCISQDRVFRFIFDRRLPTSDQRVLRARREIDDAPPKWRWHEIETGLAKGN